MTQAVQTAQFGNTNPAWRNRIINGGMVIDQRNAGASVTITANDTYTLDRWSAGNPGASPSKMSIQQSTAAPAGYVNSLLVTSLTALSVGSGDFFSVYQWIEGNNIADLSFGSASAKTITVSFWVRSSLTGQFGGALQNADRSRSYPFSYTINSANTWEQKTITISGDTSGTWLTTNGKGVSVVFGLAVGSTYLASANSWASGNYWSSTGSTNVLATNGATFYITGVQLEVGTTATSFEFRDYGRELMMCQRYLPAFNSTATGQDVAWGYMPTSTLGWLFVNFTVTARIPPTGVYVPDSTKFNITWQGGSGGTLGAGALTFASAGPNVGRLSAAVAGAPSASGAHLTANASGAQILFTGCEL